MRTKIKEDEVNMSATLYRPLVAMEPVTAESPEWERDFSNAFPLLYELPPGPWRSLGGYLDYADWPERERFAELDRSILAKRLANGLSVGHVVHNA